MTRCKIRLMFPHWNQVDEILMPCEKKEGHKGDHCSSRTTVPVRFPQGTWVLPISPTLYTEPNDLIVLGVA